MKAPSYAEEPRPPRQQATPILPPTGRVLSHGLPQRAPPQDGHHQQSSETSPAPTAGRPPRHAAATRPPPDPPGPDSSSCSTTAPPTGGTATLWRKSSFATGPQNPTPFQRPLRQAPALNPPRRARLSSCHDPKRYPPRGQRPQRPEPRSTPHTAPPAASSRTPPDRPPPPASATPRRPPRPAAASQLSAQPPHASRPTSRPPSRRSSTLSPDGQHAARLPAPTVLKTLRSRPPARQEPPSASGSRPPPDPASLQGPSDPERVSHSALPPTFVPCSLRQARGPPGLTVPQFLARRRYASSPRSPCRRPPPLARTPPDSRRSRQLRRRQTPPQRICRQACPPPPPSHRCRSVAAQAHWSGPQPSDRPAGRPLSSVLDAENPVPHRGRTRAYRGCGARPTPAAGHQGLFSNSAKPTAPLPARRSRLVPRMAALLPPVPCAPARAAPSAQPALPPDPQPGRSPPQVYRPLPSPLLDTALPGPPSSPTPTRLVFPAALTPAPPARSSQRW